MFRFSRAAALLIAVPALFVLPAPPAHSQNLFDFLGSIFRPAVRSIERLGDPDGLDRIEGSVSSRSGYCVRTCDGSFFPLSKVERGGSSPDELCASLCPAAETKVFYGSQIDTAVTKSGEAYAKMKTAFAYREQAPACGCTAKGGGTAIIDAMADPTLKPGDIVVTADGPVSFRGSRKFPYDAADFSPAKVKVLVQHVPDTPAEIRVHPKRDVAERD